ncbi:hypothetical protein D3C76_1081750 [compost metagenome]
MPHSATIATHTPMIPKFNVIPKKYPSITRNNHIVSKEEIDVKLESPAARSAEGRIKLNDHKKGCAIALNRVRENTVEIISTGGENNFINNGNKGSNTTIPIIKNPVESPRKDLINFLAS